MLESDSDDRSSIGHVAPVGVLIGQFLGAQQGIQADLRDVLRGLDQDRDAQRAQAQAMTGLHDRVVGLLEVARQANTKAAGERAEILAAATAGRTTVWDSLQNLSSNRVMALGVLVGVVIPVDSSQFIRAVLKWWGLA